MKIDTTARLLIAGGILIVLSFLLQSAPIWLPGAGLALSPFATLPVALAAALSIPVGVIVFVTSAFLLLLVSPQEAAIFLLATGLLGLALGIGYSRRLRDAYVMAAVSLFIGLFALTDLALIPVFGAATPRSAAGQFFVFLLFAAGYAALWIAAIRHTVTFLLKIDLRAFIMAIGKLWRQWVQSLRDSLRTACNAIRQHRG